MIMKSASHGNIILLHSGFKKLIPCDDICLQHALIKQVSAQRLTYDDIDGPLSNQALVDVLYLRLYHLYDVIELVVLY